MSIFCFHFFCWENTCWAAPAEAELPVTGLFGDEL